MSKRKTCEDDWASEDYSRYSYSEYDLGYSHTYPTKPEPAPPRATTSSQPQPTPAAISKVTPTYQSVSKTAPPVPPQPRIPSASQPAPTQEPPAKRQRKTKDPNAPVPEKRLGRIRKSCPQNILERVDRVMSQRFFMLDRQRNGQELKETFSVLGSTGNVYTVVIDKVPSCNCPDALKGNHCKHLLFIYLKVLQVSQASGFWYQKALLTSELEIVFAEAPAAPTAVAHARVREAYAQATGRPVASSSTADAGPKRKLPDVDDDCPICYEGMHGADVKLLVFCEECGNGLHKECFQQWAKAAARNLTCVFCRAKWAVPAPARAGPAVAGRSSGGYLNLSSIAGISPVRDTSSYYHGPSRGQRHYGYRDYNDD
ncbi:hypothetical protein DENSPDRAFT_833540 [Dentipellis sp. KUC8613]|nr:hypothetical protein DENSPDRAFT_833540 [Dentipellis sp. KUC8613]